MMKNCALVRTSDGYVVNLVIALPGSDPAPSGHLLVEIPTGVAVKVGATYAGGVFTPPPSPPPPPAPIPDLSFAQLLIGLVGAGWITEAEGTGWLAGTLPPPVLTLINSLPANQRFAARARALRPSVVVRSDPLVNALAAAQGKTAEEMDAFFRTASTF